MDWYAPWCPPCIQFLPEVRKASLEFEKSVVHFGTVDCTVHSGICRQYNIRSYPTAMLINGSTTLQFTTQKTAANVVQFIKEALNPTGEKFLNFPRESFEFFGILILYFVVFLFQLFA